MYNFTLKNISDLKPVKKCATLNCLEFRKFLVYCESAYLTIIKAHAMKKKDINKLYLIFYL